MEGNKISTLPGDYIAGFVDGEGCFYLQYRTETKLKRPNSPKYYRWLPYFAMTLRQDDVDILYAIRDTLECGKVYIGKNYEAQYCIQNIDDLYTKVLPFFTKYPLRAKKRGDFELWSTALTLIYTYRKNKISVDHKKLNEIREAMRVYKARINKTYRNKPDLN